MKRGVFGIAMLAAAFQTSAAGASKPVPLHGAVVRRTIHPRVVVRPVHVVRYQSAALARGKPYLGTVTTIPIRTSQQTLRYDAKHDRFIATQYSGGIYLISAQRKLSLLASGFYGNAIYDIARATVYAASGCEMIAINLQGSAHVLAGSTTCGTQDGKGPKAQFQGLSGIAIDTKDGALYATDVDRIRRIDPTTAEVTTFTPGGSIGSQYRSSNGFSLGIVYDPNDDRFYVADTPNDVIRAVASSGAVSTYTGRCVTQGSRCGDYQADGPPNVALFAAPSDVAFDASSRTLYVTDENNYQIRAVDAHANTTTLAGSGQSTTKDGVGLAASFSFPSTLAFRTKNNALWVTDNAVRSITTTGQPQPPGHYPVTTWTVPSLGVPSAIAGASGNQYLWFTEAMSTNIGRVGTDGSIVEYALPSGHQQEAAIAIGADGNAWFAGIYTQGSQHTGEIVRVASDGSMTPYSVRPNPACTNEYMNVDNLSLGPDGALWFYDTAGSQLGKITSSGTVTTYPQGSCFPYYTNFVVGGLGSDIWLDQLEYGLFSRYNTQGQLQNFVQYPAGPGTIGPDLNLWFLTYAGVGTYHASNGVVVLYPGNVCVSNCFGPAYGAIVTGADGALWYAANVGFSVGRLTSSGVGLSVPVPAPRSAPGGISAGPDGNLWFVDPGAVKVGRISLHSNLKRRIR